MEIFNDRNTIFLARNKKNLVISVGDSWTWGDSLGTIYQAKKQGRAGEIDDLPARSTQCYGRLLADMLDADWYNFGLRGGGNLPALRTLSDLVLGHHANCMTKASYDKIRSDLWPEYANAPSSEIYNELKTRHCASRLSVQADNYDRVYVFITLTETGRDKKEYFCFDPFPQLTKEYLLQEEHANYQLIKGLKSQCDHEFMVGRNFSIDLPGTVNSQLTVDMSWMELNYHHNQVCGFDNLGYRLDDLLHSGPVSGIALDVLREQTPDFVDYKEFFIAQTEKVEKCWRWLRNNPMHRDQASCHPTKESHKLWAEYLYSRL